MIKNNNNTFLIIIIITVVVVIVFITVIINYIWSSPGLRSFMLCTVSDTEFVQIFFQMSKCNKQEYSIYYFLVA